MNNVLNQSIRLLLQLLALQLLFLQDNSKDTNAGTWCKAEVNLFIARGLLFALPGRVKGHVNDLLNLQQLAVLCTFGFVVHAKEHINCAIIHSQLVQHLFNDGYFIDSFQQLLLQAVEFC